MTDSRQLALEAWYGSPKPLERILDGSYRYMPAHTAWLTWQASRKQALEEAINACYELAIDWGDPAEESGMHRARNKIKELLK